MKEPRKLEIHWHDAAAGGGWSAYADRDKSLIECRSIGYLLHEDKRSITLAQSYSPSTLKHADTVTIPKGWISRRRRL